MEKSQSEHEGNVFAPAGELEGGRRPSGNSPAGAVAASAHSPQTEPEPEVKPLRQRKYHTASYKLQILAELDACIIPGEKGAILRREGLYSSRITAWRRARETGALGALEQKRGRKSQVSPDALRLAALEKENAELKQQLEKAEMIIDIQKKVSQMFGVSANASVLSEKKS